MVTTITTTEMITIDTTVVNNTEERMKKRN